MQNVRRQTHTKPSGLPGRQSTSASFLPLGCHACQYVISTLMIRSQIRCLAQNEAVHKRLILAARLPCMPICHQHADDQKSNPLPGPE